MPRTCTVCAHPAREAIDRALVAGDAVRAVASRYVPLSAMAVQRHKAAHLPATLAQAREAAEVVACWRAG